MRWCAGSGERSFHDPIRTPNPPQDGGKPNPFFVDFYRQVAQSLVGLLAREHTAQVPYEEREVRENQFRSGDLTILYCSPTMELGVDIAELNVVNMRNVPPKPANYAQRSGRAGRSGQPALVFTYCSSGSPHDQCFFRRPERMVAGAVAPPRLELNNEDLIRAHIHAIWLAETGIDLKETLKEILDMSGNLELLPEIRRQAESTVALSQARKRAQSVLASIPNLDNLNELLDDTMQKVVSTFDSTCERWRNLYRSALKQVKVQESISHDPLRPSSDKKQAERLRREALSQISLLTETESLAQSDFYSYRYFATEGFLPGYSFPRLPLSAFIPARRSSQRDDFLSRPRFLAISEFGPRAIIYHEGSRYLINQVIMPVTEDEEGPLTTQIKQCANCGYIHHIKSEEDYDLCQRCGYRLDHSLQPLLRLQNVVTRRRDRINADEENRLRLGYEIRTGLRFRQKAGEPDVSTAMVKHGDDALVKLSYAQAATLWRINLGWTRRENRQQYGFVLDDDFLRAAPNFVIVDEAHSVAHTTDGRGGKHQRYELVAQLAEKPERHLILVTATPHSGKEDAFRSLLAMLNPEFEHLPDDLTGAEQEPLRRKLAGYFVQRRRADIRAYMDEATPFPEREASEQTYKLSNDYKRLFDRVLTYARETVLQPGGGYRQRVRWWSALALLRSLASSPAAAAATLRSRAASASADNEQDVNDIGRRTVLDLMTDESAEGMDVVHGSDTSDPNDTTNKDRNRLRDMARGYCCR